MNYEYFLYLILGFARSYEVKQTKTNPCGTFYQAENGRKKFKMFFFFNISAVHGPSLKEVSLYNQPISQPVYMMPSSVPTYSLPRTGI